jgi:hypothetical protein
MMKSDVEIAGVVVTLAVDSAIIDMANSSLAYTAETVWGLDHGLVGIGTIEVDAVAESGALMACADTGADSYDRVEGDDRIVLAVHKPYRADVFHYAAE